MRHTSSALVTGVQTCALPIWGDDQKRHQLQFFKIVGPYADNETEQAECDGSKRQKQHHDHGMIDMQWNEQARRGQNDRADDDRFCGDRNSGVSGKRVSVRLDLWGRRTSKKKKQQQNNEY